MQHATGALSDLNVCLHSASGKDPGWGYDARAMHALCVIESFPTAGTGGRGIAAGGRPLRIHENNTITMGPLEAVHIVGTHHVLIASIIISKQTRP